MWSEEEDVGGMVRGLSVGMGGSNVLKEVS